jgi:hypothetical protein
MERAVSEARIDYVNIWEDMAYNNGPLISPDVPFQNYAYYVELLESCVTKV